jgi:hypothetical protein
MLVRGANGDQCVYATKTSYIVKTCFYMLVPHSPGASFCHIAMS